MIHVCFGLHDATGRYSKFTCTAICSLFDNTTSAVTVHILHDSTLTQDNREKFIYLAGQYNQRVNFYNVEILYADKLNAIKKNLPNALINRYSIATFYRLLIPQILPNDIDRCIYLDSDTLVNLDIKALWQIDLGDKTLAAVPEILNRPDVKQAFSLCREGLVKREDYFNAGVLLINTKLFLDKKNLIPDWCEVLNKNPQYGEFVDQDALNYYFSTQIVHLPLKFNRFIAYARLAHELNAERKIYHFAGETFGMNIQDSFNRLWMKYFLKTPWFDEETIGRLYDGFQQMHIGLKNFMIQVSAMMSGKERVFFTVPQNLDAIKKIFSVRDDEEIILAENLESLKKFLYAMKSSHGKKVFFIVLPNFPFNLLMQAGFQFGRDFVNGFDFLSEAHGVPMNSYPLIKAM